MSKVSKKKRSRVIEDSSDEEGSPKREQTDSSRERDWFYISIDLHARKMLEVIPNDRFCMIRCCAHDAINSGSIKEGDLYSMASVLNSEHTVKDICKMTPDDFEPELLERLFDFSGPKIRLFKKATGNFINKKRSILEPLCVNIVDKFMGLNENESISIHEGDTNLSGVRLIQSSSKIPTKWSRKMEQVLERINRDINIQRENEFTNLESGMRLSEMLELIKRDVLNPMENDGWAPVVFFMDISCNGGLTPKEHAELAGENAFGIRRRKTRGKRRKGKSRRRVHKL